MILSCLKSKILYHKLPLLIRALVIAPKLTLGLEKSLYVRLVIIAIIKVFGNDDQVNRISGVNNWNALSG